jgi:hypothetical protein
MSEVHRAFSEGGGITHSRIDELLYLLAPPDQREEMVNKPPVEPLPTGLTSDEYSHACDLLMAIVSPEHSRRLHDAAAGPTSASEPHPETPVPPLPVETPPTPVEEPAEEPEPEPEPAEEDEDEEDDGGGPARAAHSRAKPPSRRR